MRTIIEVIMVLLVGVVIGGGVVAYWWNQDIHDFKADAVAMDVGFWDVNGEFDWKSPELTME